MLDPRTIDRHELARALATNGYIADDGLVMTCSSRCAWSAACSS